MWGWRVRVSVDGGGLRTAPWHPLEREPPAALLSLTQDINRSSRLARNRPEGLEELPPAPPSPHLHVGLHCARRSAGVHLRLAGEARASGWARSHGHMLLPSSFRSRH